MRKIFRLVFAAALILLSIPLSGCGSPGIDRVDVTWEVSPPPRWGLYPGYRQEIPCPRGASYTIDVYSKGKPFTSGTVVEASYSLLFKPAAGSRDIEAEAEGRDRMTVYATLRDKDGGKLRVVALRIERKDDKIFFEFPK